MTADDPTVDGGDGWPPLEDFGGDVGYEWLLSDHPWAAAERQRRRGDRLERDLAEADQVLAITGRLASDPTASEPLHRLAARLDPSARRQALAAEIDSFDRRRHLRRRSPPSASRTPAKPAATSTTGTRPTSPAPTPP